jgi:RNA polymerase sigma-70 factor (ECF subfamily)
MKGRKSNEASDEQLIRQAVGGSKSAFTALVRRYEATVYGFAFKVCRDGNKARETLQDTFISVYRKLGSFDGKSKFSTWLYAIVSNNCLMTRRRRKIDDLLESLDDSPPASTDGTTRHPEAWGETPADLLLARELESILERALTKLPVDYRVVFVLRDMEGKTTEETAAIVGISQEAAKSRLRRARAFLREELHPYMAADRA